VPASYPTTATYAYPDTQAPTSTAYPSSYQTVTPATYYPQTTHTSSYAPSPEQPAQSQAYSYETTGAETTYPTYYATTSPYAQQASDYTAQGSDRHVPKPVTIKQCSCLGCDVDGKPDNRPKLRDGKDVHKKSSSSSKKGESSRNKHSSSKKSESSKSKAVSTSDPFEIRLASVDAQVILFLSTFQCKEVQSTKRFHIERQRELWSIVFT
jgi:hypothetical protein